MPALPLRMAGSTLGLVFGSSFVLSVIYPRRRPMFTIFEDQINTTHPEPRTDNRHRVVQNIRYRLITALHGTDVSKYPLAPTPRPILLKMSTMAYNFGVTVMEAFEYETRGKAGQVWGPKDGSTKAE